VGWSGGNRQLTVDEVVSDGGTIAQAVVVDVATLSVEVLGDGDQVANGGGCADVREVLSGLVLQANLPKGIPTLVHDADLGVEVLEVYGVCETGLNVDLRIDQCPVPSFDELLRRVETVDHTRTELRVEHGQVGDEGGRKPTLFYQHPSDPRRRYRSIHRSNCSRVGRSQGQGQYQIHRDPL